MTKKQALIILLKAASNDIRGAGRGYKTTTEEYRQQVREAAKKLWKDAHGYEYNDNVAFNYF